MNIENKNRSNPPSRTELWRAFFGMRDRRATRAYLDMRAEARTKARQATIAAEREYIKTVLAINSEYDCTMEKLDDIFNEYIREGEG